MDLTQPTSDSSEEADLFGEMRGLLARGPSVKVFEELCTLLERCDERSQRREGIDYLEAQLSRLYGHSSSSGSNYVDGETDCLVEIEKKLVQNGWRTEEELRQMRERIEADMQAWYKQVKGEPKPSPEDAFDYVFADKNIVGGEV